MEKTILFAGVVLCLAWHASASCGVSDINWCIGKLKTFLTLHELNTEHSVMKFDDRHELDTICNDFYEARTCMADVAPHCDTPMKEVWEGMNDGYVYLCALSTRKDLMQYNPCIVKHADILESMTSRCATDYKKFMKNHMDSESYCRRKPEMMSCFIDPIEERCGPEAAKLQSEYTTRTLNPMDEMMGCIRVVHMTSTVQTLPSRNFRPAYSFWRKENPFVWMIGSLIVFALFITVLIISRRVRVNQGETHSEEFVQVVDGVSFLENSKVPYGKLTHESA